jgi:hypothetical protein
MDVAPSWMKRHARTRRSSAPEVVTGIEQAFTKVAKGVKGRVEDESMTLCESWQRWIERLFGQMTAAFQDSPTP